MAQIAEVGTSHRRHPGEARGLALQKWLGRAAAVMVAVMTAVVGLVTPAHAAVQPNVGWACHNGVGLDQIGQSAACVWMNIDHTNMRIRAYAEANGAFQPAEANPYWSSEVALSYLRLQRLSSNGQWQDVPGTMVNDLDGWQEIDRVTGVLWSCNPNGGTYRAAMHGKYHTYGNPTIHEFNSWTRSWTYGQFGC